MLVQVTLLVTTYLVAAVPTGLLLTALFTDVDIRRAGSGNIGATNVYRLAGRGFGAATLALDVLKGFVPVLLAHALWPSTLGISAVLLAAFVGHCHGPYLDFRGGKGVATGVGGFLAAAPFAAIVALGGWIAAVAVTRTSSAGALVGIAALWLALLAVPGYRPLLPVAAVVGLWMIVRHRDNIRRLLGGDEGRF